MLKTDNSSLELNSKTTPLQKWIYLCFFLSGMNALIYEVSWLNRIQLIMGHTVYSLSTTLAAYMSGLALGSLYVPKLKRSGVNALYLYLVAELLIGIYGLLFYPLLKLTQIPYDFLVSLTQLSLLSTSLIQFVFCTILIIIPTFLMGTTLPLIGPYIYPEKNEISRKLPILYAYNTLGAMFGCFATGFFILPILGYTKTVLFAAAVNIGLYFIVNFLADLKQGGGMAEQSFPSLRAALKAFLKILIPEKRSAQQRPYSAASDYPDFITLFISGFASMLIQVVWGRMTSLCFGPTVYVFPVVTTVVLAGIVLGSWAWRKLSVNPMTADRIFVLLPLASGLALMAGNLLFTQAPRSVLGLDEIMNPGFIARTVLAYSWEFGCLLVPATLIGALFPAAVTRLTREQDSDEGTRSIGIGYALNILGLMSGALLGSFILLPYLGIEHISQGLAIILFALSALLAISVTRQSQAAVAIIAIGGISMLIFPSFNWNLLTSGFFYNRYRKITSESIWESGWNNKVAFLSIRAPVIARNDDPHATISIHQGRLDKTYRNFKVNGKVDGTNSGDLKTTRLLSAFPALFNAEARSALIIGLGTGSTAAQALRYPRMEKVKIIELSSAMIEFSKKYFSNVDGDIWDDSRLSIEQRDGRDYLDHTRETYDVIVSEPSNPWVDGVASLFTKEFYESVSKRLNPGGIASLWFHSYGLDCQSVQSVFSAAAEVFPSMLVFKQGGDFFIMASKDPDGLKPRRLPKEASVLETILLEESDISPTTDVADNYRKLMEKTLIFDRDGAMNLNVIAPTNEDDNQYLQFRSGRTYHTGISCADLPGSASKDLIAKYSYMILQ